MPHAAERVQALYDEMISLWLAGNADLKPNATTFKSVIITWGRKGGRKTSNTGRGRERDVTAAWKAQAVFEDMQRYYQQQLDDDLRPNGSVYTALMYAWAKVGDAHRVESILRNMESPLVAASLARHGVKPDWVYAYNLTMDAWAHSKHPKAPHMAQALFEHMIRKSKMGFPELKPNLHSFSNLIKVWGRTNCFHGATQAQYVFSELLRHYHESGVMLSYNQRHCNMVP